MARDTRGRFEPEPARRPRARRGPQPKCPTCRHLWARHGTKGCTASYSAGPSGTFRCRCIAEQHPRPEVDYEHLAEEHQAGCRRGISIAHAVAGAPGRLATRCEPHGTRMCWRCGPPCDCAPLVHAWGRWLRSDKAAGKDGTIACGRCGVCRPADGHADAGPCPGVVRITTREAEPVVPEPERPWPNERAR